MRRQQPTKRDANEPEIIKALRAAGASVTQLDDRGVPDLLVGYKGFTILLEVKLPDGPKGGRRGGGRSSKHEGGDGLYTADQLKWNEAWKGEPVPVVRTPADALARLEMVDDHLGQLSRQFSRAIDAPIPDGPPGS